MRSDIRQISLFLCSLLWIQNSAARVTRWVTVNTVNARPLALGGAFQAIDNDWASIHWNPAAFDNPSSNEKTHFAVRLNPLGPVILISDTRSVDRAFTPVSLCISGIRFKFKQFGIGILTGEESLNNVSRLERGKLIDGNGYEWARSIDVAFHINFSQKVRLGVALQSMIRQTHGERWGYRYGLLMQPKPYLQVGLCYYDMSDLYADDRLNLERIADETLNIGIALQPFASVLMTADIRNVSDEDATTTREPHIGMEFSPMQQIALRAGYAYQLENEVPVYSWGLGIKSHLRAFPGISWGVDIAYVLEKERLDDVGWGILGVFLEL